MDYPKSVPGVGLVGGRFVDEDTSTGQQGSLIPSAWGNSVTEELLAVIRAAGVEPSEDVQDQVAKILWADPSETKRGMPLVGSQSDLEAGESDTVFATPKKLRKGFSVRLNVNGFIAFPTWLSGLVIQWGSVPLLSSTQDTIITFPMAFPSRAYMFMINHGYTPGGSGSIAYCSGSFISQTQAAARSSSSSLGAFWFSIGS